MEKDKPMAPAPAHATLHRLILLILLAGATFCMARYAGVRVSHQSGVAERLPDQVGAWTGEELLFCQTMTCQWNYTRSEIGTNTACTQCGGTLSSGSPVEWALLPDDTEILKKVYRRPDGPQLVAAIVLSGADRTSIHRPQICLVGGGQEITAARRRSLPRAEGGTFEVEVLDLLWRGRSEDGRDSSRERFFAYWFVGPKRQTASHWTRMFWMGFERIFLGESHRWAYINISGSRSAGSDAHLQALDEFARDFYPQVVKSAAARPAPDSPGEP